jgi:SAM-dependent methyltransferase
MTPLADLKEIRRSTWSAGDYGAVAELVDVAPPADLFTRRPVAPGEDVLDVATGTGNVAIHAARAGARVAGLDRSPELLEIAERRASQAGVFVDWLEGDAEALPFDDESFDTVLSVFGARAADELARVCRPCGRVGLIDWTPDGAFGQVHAILGHTVWGSESHVSGAFAGTGVAWSFARGYNPWRFASAEAWTRFMETNYGPAVDARVRLTAEDRWEERREEIVDLVERLNVARDGSFLLRAEYLVAIGRKAG